jgi:hypothetical protein
MSTQHAKKISGFRKPPSLFMPSKNTFGENKMAFAVRKRLLKKSWGSKSVILLSWEVSKGVPNYIN